MPNHNVTVYSTPTCHFCTKLKNYLKENNVEFKEINVAEDQNAAKEMVEKTGSMGVPVTDIDGKFIIGFDKDKIKAALGL